ncbi:MAG: hypothetical protein AAGA73_04930 [Pseudomonadota bacterium]
MIKSKAGGFGAGMRFSATSRGIARLIIMALLLQPWLSQNAVAKASDSLASLVICTATGFKVIEAPWGDWGSDQPAEPLDHHDPAALNCAACLIQALGKLDGTGRADPPSPHDYLSIEISAVDLWIAEPCCHGLLGSRGPP